MKFKLMIRWYDMYIGLYYDKKNKYLYIVFLTLVLRITFTYSDTPEESYLRNEGFDTEAIVDKGITFINLIHRNMIVTALWNLYKEYYTALDGRLEIRNKITKLETQYEELRKRTIDA